MLQRFAGSSGGALTGSTSNTTLPVEKGGVLYLQAAPTTTEDVWLRLHLLSARLVRPHAVNLDGVFGLLANVVWTSAGPCAVEGFELTRARLLTAVIAAILTRASAISRSPSVEASRTLAPSASSAGAQSVDETATQRLLAVATQQVSPGLASGDKATVTSSGACKRLSSTMLVKAVANLPFGALGQVMA